MKNSRALALASCIILIVIFVFAPRFRLCAQPLAAAADIAGMTPVTNRAELPKEGATFWVMEGGGRPIYPIPCVPGDFPNAPVYFLGTNGQYLVDATSGQTNSSLATNASASSSADGASYIPMDGVGGDGSGGTDGGGGFGPGQPTTSYPSNAMYLLVRGITR